MLLTSLEERAQAASLFAVLASTHRLTLLELCAGRGYGLAELGRHLPVNHQAVKAHVEQLVTSEMLTSAPGKVYDRCYYHTSAFGKLGLAVMQSYLAAALDVGR